MIPLSTQPANDVGSHIADRIILDYFAGGGGVSLAIHQAIGRSPDVAVNHCEHAIRIHALNHPDTKHLRTDVWDVDPHKDLPEGDVGFAWFSPDCRHFSHAKGSAPVEKKIRGLAWVALRVAAKRRPALIFLENVQEFRSWGPLNRRRRPIKSKAGATFARFCEQLRELGYAVEHRVLNAADYGAPTNRRRFILIARCDGQPIAWPTPTHGPGRANPYRTAAQCIDWSLPCPSIFGRGKSLVPKTMRRIAEGVRRFILQNPTPFVVNGSVLPTMVQSGYGERPGQTPRALDLHAPIGTIVAGGAKQRIVCCYIAKHNGGKIGAIGQAADEPMHTITAVNNKSVIAAQLQPVADTGREDRRADVAALLDAHFPGTSTDGVVTVTIDGEVYAIVDIGSRMISSEELKVAQGLPANYVLEGTERDRIARIGNSVPPPLARAVIAANAREALPHAAAAE